MESIDNFTLRTPLMTAIFICKLIEPFSFLDMKEVKVPVLLQQMDFVGETEF